MPDERKPAPVETDFNRDDIETINLFKQFPLWFIGLMFVGINKCCAAEQLFRWLDEYEADWSKCIAAIGKLITSRFVQKLSRTELKNLNLSEDCIIFYPTNRGFNEVDIRSVWSHNPGDLLRDQFSHGNPCSMKKPRVVHQLTCAESLLFLIEQDHFVWFESEGQLQSQIRQKDAKRRKSRLPPLKNLGTGDFNVRVLDQTGEFWEKECEIINKMSVSQIKKKPNGLYLFCNSEEKRQVIMQATGEDPVIVGDFFEPEWVTEMLKEEYYSKGARRETQVKLFDQIKLYGGIVTSRLLAMLNPLKGEDFYRAKLEELYDQGRVDKTSGCLVPGTSRGRNVNFYYLPELEVENNYVALRNGIFRCYTLQKLSEKYKFEEYVEETNGLVFTKDNVSLLLINDQEFKSLEDNAVSYHKNQIIFTAYKIILVCADADRLNFYKKEKKFNTFSLCSLPETRSYREKD